MGKNENIGTSIIGGVVGLILLIAPHFCRNTLTGIVKDTSMYVDTNITSTKDENGNTQIHSSKTPYFIIKVKTPEGKVVYLNDNMDILDWKWSQRKIYDNVEDEKNYEFKVYGWNIPWMQGRGIPLFSGYQTVKEAKELE